jgi:hypothetical protein
MASKPVVLPEPYNGETSWEDWMLHFEDVAAVNEWTNDQKMALCGPHWTSAESISSPTGGIYGLLQRGDDSPSGTVRAKE